MYISRITLCYGDTKSEIGRRKRRRRERWERRRRGEIGIDIKEPVGYEVNESLVTCQELAASFFHTKTQF